MTSCLHSSVVVGSAHDWIDSNPIEGMGEYFASKATRAELRSYFPGQHILYNRKRKFSSTF